MDTRFQITDAPREIAPGGQVETPLVTLAWRALRAEHQRRTDERRNHDAGARQIQTALASIAADVYHLRQTIGAMLSASETGRPGDIRQLQLGVSRLEEILTALDLNIIAPKGMPFTTELMELFDNIAQQPALEAGEPYIAEIVVPAITFRGALLRMGKAVIAVPSGTSAVQSSK